MRSPTNFKGLYTHYEYMAALDCKRQLLEIYGIHITFHGCSLAEAIKATFNVPIKSRKILGLYFHNREDTFSNVYCSSLGRDDISEICNRSFYMLGWNVSKVAFNTSLNNSLDACFGVISTELQSLVTERQAAFIAMIILENEPCIIAVLRGSVEAMDVLTTLKAVENIFNEQNIDDDDLAMENLAVAKSDTPVGYREFQQLMHVRLSNRDYDLFESHQHNWLKKKIGFAKFGSPNSTLGYDINQDQIINETYNQICKYNNKYAEYEDQIIISVIYNCLEPLPKDKLERTKKYQDYNPQTDFSPIPIFVILKCRDSENSCRIFIDNDNRVYDSWYEYLKHNKHYKCIMVVPQDGKYVEDEKGVVILERYYSPSCGIKADVLNVTDIGSSVTGLASAAVFATALIPAITVAPIVLTAASITGIGVGVYSIVRSGFSIFDRKKYGESMSFANSQARGAYLNILAGSLGFVGAGATRVVSQLATRGVNITKGAQYAVNTINVCTITASGISVGNSSFQILDEWINEQRKPSLLTIMQLSSSILFFANAAYNYKSASTITKEAQFNALKKYEESLRSNRHRKTFNKLLKETIRQNNGDITKGYAKVISTCRKIMPKDEVFAVLTRNNKAFNKDGIRFYADGKDIKLNGISVDLNELGNMPTAEKLQFLNDLPAIPEAIPENKITRFSKSEINSVVHKWTYVAKYCNLIHNGATLGKLIYELLKDFSAPIQNKICNIFDAIVDMLMDKFDLDTIFRKYFNFHFSEPVKFILELIIEFLEKYAIQYEKKYHQAMRSTNFKQQGLNNGWVINPYFVKKSITLVEMFVSGVVSSNGINRLFLLDLLKFISQIIAEQIYEYSTKLKHEQNRRGKKGCKYRCPSCSGYYFRCLK